MARFPSRFMLRGVDTDTGDRLEIWLRAVSTMADDGQRVTVLEVVESRVDDRKEPRNG